MTLRNLFFFFKEKLRAVAGEKLTRISLLDSTELNPKQDSSGALGTAFR